MKKGLVLGCVILSFFTCGVAFAGHGHCTRCNCSSWVLDEAWWQEQWERSQGSMIGNGWSPAADAIVRERVKESLEIARRTGKCECGHMYADHGR